MTPFWFRRFWWVGAFCLLAASLYAKGSASRETALAELRTRLFHMEQEFQSALEDRDDLSLQLASQEDPAWIELVLLRQMGVVPEGFLKVHFKSP